MDKTILNINYRIQLFLLFIILLISCDNNNNNNNENIKKAIEITNNNKSIKDSLSSLKRKGIDFVVCFIENDSIYDRLSFQLAKRPDRKFYTYNIDTNFKIKSIEGVNVLFRDFNDTVKVTERQNDKITIKLLNENIISFNERNKLYNFDFIKFVFCHDNLQNFKCFNSKNLNSEYEKAYNERIVFFENFLYPKCD